MRHLLSMTWRDALFAHWSVDPDVVQASLPNGLDVAAYEGDAHLGVVAFVMDGIRPRGLPEPLGLTFGELNLRTYVEGPDGDRGIYFYNLDAADPLGVTVARLLYQLPYYRADMTIDEREARSEPRERVTEIEFRSHRIHPGVPEAHFDATYRPTERVPPREESTVSEGSLEQFLVENYCFFTESADGTLYRGDVDHPPWPLRTADLDLRTNDLLTVNGFADRGDPEFVHYSPGVDVTATRIYPVD